MTGGSRAFNPRRSERKTKDDGSIKQQRVPRHLPIARRDRSDDVTAEISDEPCAVASSGRAWDAIHSQSTRPGTEYPPMCSSSGVNPGQLSFSPTQA